MNMKKNKYYKLVNIYPKNKGYIILKIPSSHDKLTKWYKPYKPPNCTTGEIVSTNKPQLFHLIKQRISLPYTWKIVKEFVIIFKKILY